MMNALRNILRFVFGFVIALIGLVAAAVWLSLAMTLLCIHWLPAGLIAIAIFALGVELAWRGRQPIAWATMWISGGLGIATLLLMLVLPALQQTSMAQPTPMAPVAETKRLPAEEQDNPTSTPEPEPESVASQPQNDTFSLSGLCYDGYVGDTHVREYDACWTNDGRLWQSDLPRGPERQAHTVAIVLVKGTYSFNGVECALHLDESKNGKSASNPVTVSFGNDQRFTVSIDEAWAFISCRGNASSGFDIWALDW